MPYFLAREREKKRPCLRLNYPPYGKCNDCVKGTCRYDKVCFMCGQTGHGAFQSFPGGKMKGDLKCSKHRNFNSQLATIQSEYGMDEDDLKALFELKSSTSPEQSAASTKVQEKIDGNEPLITPSFSSTTSPSMSSSGSNISSNSQGPSSYLSTVSNSTSSASTNPSPVRSLGGERIAPYSLTPSAIGSSKPSSVSISSSLIPTDIIVGDGEDAPSISPVRSLSNSNSLFSYPLQSSHSTQNSPSMPPVGSSVGSSSSPQLGGIPNAMDSTALATGTGLGFSLPHAHANTFSPDISLHSSSSHSPTATSPHRGSSSSSLAWPSSSLLSPLGSLNLTTLNNGILEDGGIARAGSAGVQTLEISDDSSGRIYHLPPLYPSYTPINLYTPLCPYTLYYSL